MTFELISVLILGIVILAVASMFVVLFVEIMQAPARISSDSQRERMDHPIF